MSSQPSRPPYRSRCRRRRHRLSGPARARTTPPPLQLRRGPRLRLRLPLRPALRPAPGAGPGAGLRRRRDGALQVLRWRLRARPLQPRPDEGPPAAGRGAAATRAQRGGGSLLPAHAPRGPGLPGQRPPLAQGGEAAGRRLQLCGLRGWGREEAGLGWRWGGMGVSEGSGWRRGGA